MTSRFDRQERLFGKEGQDKLAAAKVAVVGVGGLGSQVAQQLGLLGVGGIALIDAEELANTDRNRNPAARHDDSIPGTRKVDIAQRMVAAIAPEILVETVADSLISDVAFKAMRNAGYVLGCLDTEGGRLVLTEFCAAYSKPFIDLSSDILPGDPIRYGGQVCVSWNGNGCLVCRSLIDLAEAQAELDGELDRKNREAIYGVHSKALSRSGPSVVSVNGVVASLAVTEFLVGVTGLRPVNGLVTYRGHIGGVGISKDEPAPDCYYCKALRGAGEAADVERYIRAGLGATLR